MLICVILAAVCITNLYMSIPSWMHYDTTYQSVFFGAVKESETPEKDLPLVNTHAIWMTVNIRLYNNRRISARFLRQNIKSECCVFLFRHPVRFVKKIAFSIENASCLRPLNSGNSETVLMQYSNRFSLWSNLRVATKFLYNPYIVFAMAIIMTLYVIFVHIYLLKIIKKPMKKGCI